MNPSTKEFIEAHINKILEEFSFNNRKLKYPEKCICYEQNKPCHKFSEDKLNCFLCYCPNYNLDIEEGSCKIGSEKGKWFFNEKLPKGKIWDCSDCEIPHKKETAKKFLRTLFGIN